MNDLIKQLTGPTLLQPHRLNLDLTAPSAGEKKVLGPQELAIATGLSSNADKYKPFAMSGDIAIIPVNGVLLHKLGWSWSGATGYDVIARKLLAARADPDVKGILTDYHTPGGGVMGCADAADLIYQISQQKPLWSLCCDMNLSAGQWLASQGSRRLITQSGSAGSIGVYMMHLSMEKALEAYGYKATMVYDGEHKVDGNPYEDLPKNVKARFQAEVKETRKQFATAVARGTGMSVDDVLATEAMTYTGQEAVDIGLADAVVSQYEVLEEFNEHLASSGKLITLGESAMSNPTAPAASTPTEPSASDQQAAVATAVAQARKDEQSRISSIMTGEQAQGRQELASHLAYNTDMTPEAASAVLAASPKAQSEPETPQENSNATAAEFDKMMHKSAPNLSPKASSEPSDDPDGMSAEQEQVQSLAKNYQG